jgi:hypothetical protein
MASLGGRIYMNSKKLSQWMFVFILILLLLTSCGPGQMFGPTITPSPTSTPTFTPTPTPTSTPTFTPTPTPTPTPSVEDVLTEIGFTRDESIEPTCETLCKAYSIITFDAGGFVIMNVAIYDNGQLRVIYIMTAETSYAGLNMAMKIVRAAYGDKIAEWMESHFTTPGTVNTGNEVVDGHWVAVGAGKIENNMIKVMLIVSPDTSVPAGIDP